MYAYPSSSLVRSATTASTGNSSVIAIVALVCAIVGSILVFVLFLRKDNESKYTGFVKWLYDFLQFNKLAIFITVLSFGLISTSFLGFLLFLILGNLVLRVAYEFSMLVILLYRNVRELTEKTKK